MGIKSGRIESSKEIKDEMQRLELISRQGRIQCLSEESAVGHAEMSYREG